MSAWGRCWPVVAMGVALVWAGCSGSGDDDDTYSAAGTGGSTRPGNTGGNRNTATGGNGNTATGGRRNTTPTGGTTPVTGDCPGSQPDDGSECSLADGEDCFYGNGTVTCTCNSSQWQCTNRTGATGGRSNATGGAENTGGRSAATGGTAEGGSGPSAGAPPETGGTPVAECPAEQPGRRDPCSGSQTCSYDGFDCTCTDDRWRCTEATGTGGTEPGTGGTTQTEGGSSDGGATETGGTTQTEGGASPEGGSTQTEGGSTGTGGTSEVVCPADPPRDGNDCDAATPWCDYPDQDPTLACVCTSDSGWRCHIPGETLTDCPAQPPRDGNNCDPDLPWCDYADPALTCYCDGDSGWRCI
jgi:hypothetical protein